ncbi:hypothetical protein QTH97_13850 [Variovorax sp. J22R24]|uniref:pilus assembly PilX family protein n=1 Tax=Variovorax gracilis TaxID=3053502 RepID=UPI00257835AF|nr:hypothetical protein [Variovorax sp. J22R24]MDM0106022.1 hypothetical protein [Variovorax sp. J22R24]
MKPSIRQRASARPASQRGVVLIVALVVLVVMTLAGLLMFRSSRTGVEVAGNIGFKQNATSLGDLGVETGRAFLMGFVSDGNPLLDDIPASGYYASWNEGFNPLSYDWDEASKEAIADDGTGNRVRYVIHRLCKVVGATTAPGQQCAIPSTGSGAAADKGGSNPGLGAGTTGQPYYRITSRVDGPRSTVSYVQVIMF